MNVLAYLPLDRAKRFGQQAQEGVLSQLSALRREISTLAGGLADLGARRLGDAGDGLTSFADEAKHRGAEIARLSARQAGAAARAVKDDPVPTIVALGTALLLIRLIFDRD